MGTWNYSIELKLDISSVERLMQEYHKDSAYQTAFSFSLKPDGDTKYNAVFMSIVDNFLPANYLFFDFLSISPQNVVPMRSNGVEFVFPNNSRVDFMSFMFNIWEEKLGYVYSHFGAFLIAPSMYYKARRRLVRKYYKRVGQ